MTRDWIVIEGDNGTGKDTLALSLDYTIISAMDEIRSAEKKAKTRQGSERFHEFLKYNQKCAQMAESYPHSVLIRYWPSTLAGAYADNSLSEEEFDQQLHYLKDWPKPSLFVLLRCEYEKRVQRIITRNNRLTNIGLCDNIQLERSNRHWNAMQKILNCFPNHIILDNTNLSQEEVLQKLQARLNCNC